MTGSQAIGTLIIALAVVLALALALVLERRSRRPGPDTGTARPVVPADLPGPGADDGRSPVADGLCSRHTDLPERQPAG